MKISEIRITLRDEIKLKGFANVTFDDCFVVSGVKVIQGSKGYFVSMPSRRRTDGTYSDIAHPTNQKMREDLEIAVLKAYSLQLKYAQSESSKDGVNTKSMESQETNIWPERQSSSG